jgi:hypothetical protein
MIKSRRMRLAGNVAPMGRREMHIAYWSESQEKSLKDQDVGGWIILKWMLERYDGVVWTGLIWLGIGTNGGLL